MAKPEDMRTLGLFEDPLSLGIRDNESVFCVENVVKSYSLAHLIPEGTYKMQLIVVAENAAPKSQVVKLKIDGNCHEDARQMWGEGVGVES